MGRVPINQQGKFFEGTPTNATNLSDANSVQGAVKGSVNNPASVTKNASTIASLSKLDMFIPKRTTLPIDAATFRLYPTPSITISDSFTTTVISENNLQGTLTLVLSVNNKVGYNYRIDFEIYTNNNKTSFSTATKYMAAGETSFRNTSFTGAISNSIEINFPNVTTNTVCNVDFFFTDLMNTDSFNAYPAFNTNGLAYFNRSNFAVNVGATSPYTRRFSVRQVDFLSCFGDPISSFNNNLYTNVTTLGNNAQVFLNAEGTQNYPTGIYENQNPSTGNYSIFEIFLNTSTGKTQIRNFTNCGSFSGRF